MSASLRERRQMAKMFRKAAEIVANAQLYRGCCGALGCAALTVVRSNAPEVGAKCQRVFAKFFKPHASAIYYWPVDQEHMQARVIALLLMADMIESGEVLP